MWLGPMMNLPCCLETINWLEWLTCTKSLLSIYWCCLNVIPLMSAVCSLPALWLKGSRVELAKWAQCLEVGGHDTETLYKQVLSLILCTFRLLRVQSLKCLVVLHPRNVKLCSYPEFLREKSMIGGVQLSRCLFLLSQGEFSFLRVCVCVCVNKFLAFGLCRLQPVNQWVACTLSGTLKRQSVTC